MKNIIVAPIGPYIDALYLSIKEFPTERIFLITPENKLDDAEKVKKDLAKFRIPVDVVRIDDEKNWEGTFRAISEIKASLKDRDIIVNVGTAERNVMCAATTAAFVNGLRAVSVGENEMLMPLPVLKFSYYKLLSDKKMEIIKILFREKQCCASLDELSKNAKMSLPLIAYHINGNLKSEGLKSMGLVTAKEHKGKIKVTLTELGQLLVKGYVE